MADALDLRGLCCPEPMDRTWRALASKPLELRVLVDDPSARDNLTRLGARLGYSVETKDEATHEEIVLRRR